MGSHGLWGSSLFKGFKGQLKTSLFERRCDLERDVVRDDYRS